MQSEDIVQRHRVWAGITKQMVPFIARAMCGPRAAALVQMAEIFVQAVRGKGAGTGWDFAGETKAALRVIKSQRPVLIDVGANKGGWSATMQAHFGGQARVVLVEPSPSCCREITAAAIPNSTLLQCAAGETSGDGELFSPYPGAGIASLHARRDSFFENLTFASQPVQIRTLDDIIRECGLTSVDFVKIDAEGHDLFVLRGSAAALKGGLIRALSFEFGAGNVNSRTFFRDFWDFLAPFQCALFRVCPGGGLLPITRYYEDLEHFRGVSNYIAVFPG